MKILKGRVLIKKLDGTSKSVYGLEIPEDSDSLPKAEIIDFAEDIADMRDKYEKPVIVIGDIVYYMEPRERGRCKYKGEEHFIVSIANIIAII